MLHRSAHIKMLGVDWAWWCTLVITALRRRLRQEDQTWFKASVGYKHIESLFEKQGGRGKMAHQVK